jgi:acyl-CoA synthetase (AMP-forming)/AMP-acid ligase II
MTTFYGPLLSEEAGIGTLTLPGLLEEVCQRHGDREALVFPAGNVRLTYAELYRRARSLAKALLASGLSKGTRVAVLLGNRPEWVEAAFGVTMAGGVMVPLNTWFEPPELDYVLRHCDASLIITQDRLLHRGYVDELVALCPELCQPSPVRSARFPYLRELVVVGVDPHIGAATAWEEFLGCGDDLSDELLTAATAEVSPRDDAVVIYTSGSTARPKGVLHPHQAAALQSWRFAQHLRIDPTTRTWSAFPLFWTAGFAMIMGGTLSGGGCLVLEEHFEAGEALGLLQAERVTAAHAWPHQLGELEDHPDWASVDLSSLRQVEAFSSFGRHPTVHVDDVWSPRQAFGLTETFTIISSDPADTPRHGDELHSGHILPGNAIRILEPETGRPQPAGAMGEIAVKGPTLMKCYLKADSVLDGEGFFHTGDAGFVDAEGQLHWTGRTSDLIKTGGANVSPVEIETALLHHTGLKAAHAVGVTDALMGEVVVVCAVAHEGAEVDEQGVRRFLRGRIASYKIPRRVLFVDERDLSLTGNAKIRTEALRALATQRLGAPAVTTAGHPE